jgi:hypothetical protein
MTLADFGSEPRGLSLGWLGHGCAKWNLFFWRQSSWKSYVATICVATSIWGGTTQLLVIKGVNALKFDYCPF